jgi:dTDP-4-dehydrorhamnose 3,5-epimerase
MVTRGSVFDVAVDIRKSSPTFGAWFGIELTEENCKQMWIPPWFAHGFVATSDVADFFYKCTDVYVPEADAGIVWNDPDIGILWPVKEPLLSKKDAAAPRLRDSTRLPT